MLTQSRLRELLNYDPETGVFVRRVGRPGPRSRAGDVAGCDNGQGYVRIYVDGTPHKGHRLAWLHVYGDWPKGEIDHINGNRADNRIENLRDVDRARNNMNRPVYRNNASGLKGVSFVAKSMKWKAQIQHNGRKIGLGYFDTKEVAYAAYQAAEQQAFGEYARQR